MTTKDQPRPDGPASLATSAEKLLNEAIDIQGAARGWLAATHEAPHLEPGTRDGAIETAFSIDATVDGLGWSSQAFHRASDPGAPPWQRETPPPLVADTDGELTPADPSAGAGEPVTRAELSAQAHSLAEDLDDLGSSIENLTTASRDWLDHAQTQGDDPAVQEHSRRAHDNLGDTLTMCCYTAERAEISAENLAGPQGGTTEQVPQVVDEAENGLNDLRRHDAASTPTRDGDGVDDTEALWTGVGSADRDVETGPALEQDPPF